MNPRARFRLGVGAALALATWLAFGGVGQLEFLGVDVFVAQTFARGQTFAGTGEQTPEVALEAGPREPGLENRRPLLENGLEEGPIPSGIEMEGMTLPPKPHQSPTFESLDLNVRVGRNRCAIPDGQGRRSGHLRLNADQ